VTGVDIVVLFGKSKGKNFVDDPGANLSAFRRNFPIDSLPQKVRYHYLQIGQASFEGRVSEADWGLLSLVSPTRSLWRPHLPCEGGLAPLRQKREGWL